MTGKLVVGVFKFMDILCLLFRRPLLGSEVNDVAGIWLVCKWFQIVVYSSHPAAAFPTQRYFGGG